MTKSELKKHKENKWMRWIHQDKYREHFPEFTVNYIESFENEKSNTQPGQAFPVRTILEANAQGLSLAGYNNGVYLDGDIDGLDMEKFNRLDIIDQDILSRRSSESLQRLNDLMDEQKLNDHINNEVEAEIKRRNESDEIKTSESDQAQKE